MNKQSVAVVSFVPTDNYDNNGEATNMLKK